MQMLRRRPGVHERKSRRTSGVHVPRFAVWGGCGSAPALSSANDNGSKGSVSLLTAHDTQTTRQCVECKSNAGDDRQGHTLYFRDLQVK